MYHPAAGTPGVDAENYEFVELLNTGLFSFDMTGMQFDDGITFIFPAGLILDAGARLVVAKDTSAFAERYPGVVALGPYSGRLKNSGERVTLRDSVGSSGSGVGVTAIGTPVKESVISPDQLSKPALKSGFIGLACTPTQTIASVVTVRKLRNFICVL